MASNGNNDKGERIDNILNAAGILVLGAKPRPDEILPALERLGSLLIGADPLIVEMCRQAAVATFKLGHYCDAPSRMVDAALKATPKREDETEYVTYGTTQGGAVIIDIVQRGRNLEWVTARPGSGRVRIVETVSERVKWPRHTLPWAIPSVEQVQKAIDLGARSPFEELVFLFKRLAVLPEPQTTYADLLAAWVLGTYRLDEFSYFPELLLEGPPERGKTRIGKAVIFTAFRGMATPSPTPAVIFRQRARHRIGLFLDVADLPGLLYRNPDINDLLLHSSEVGGMVSRVTHPDAPPPEQIENFAVYGPTILATNEAIKDESALASRCIRIPMPEAGGEKVPDALGQDARVALAMRAQCVAWAAQAVADGKALPQGWREFKGRLNDLWMPLLRVLKDVCPEAMPELIKLVRAGAEVQKKEVSGTKEARVAVAMWELHEFVKDRKLANVIVVEHINKTASAGEEITSQQVGYARRSLGLHGTKGGARGTAYIDWPGDAVVKELHDRYSTS